MNKEVGGAPLAAGLRGESAGARPSERASGRGKLVLEARDLVRTYRMGHQELQILQGAHLRLHAGEVVAIMGRSGAGKSTLLHLLGLLDRPDAGSLTLGGTETTRLSRRARARLRNREVGFVFQFYHLIPELNTLQNAALPLMIELGPLQWMAQRKRLTERTRELLAELGLADRLGHRPGQLSGGERQRVAIARALATRPSMLLCDEPTGNLDERTSESITGLLFELSRRHGQTLVLVTHDRDLAGRADRCLQLHEGKLEADLAER